MAEELGTTLAVRVSQRNIFSGQHLFSTLVSPLASSLFWYSILRGAANCWCKKKKIITERLEFIGVRCEKGNTEFYIYHYKPHNISSRIRGLCLVVLKFIIWNDRARKTEIYFVLQKSFYVYAICDTGGRISAEVLNPARWQESPMEPKCLQKQTPKS